MKKTNIQTTLNDGAVSSATSLISIGSALTNELRAILKKLHAWATIFGRRRLLRSLHTPIRQCAQECTSHLTGQRLSRTLPPKKSVSKLERLSVKKYSSYSIKGELPTVRQRLTDRSWSK